MSDPYLLLEAACAFADAHCCVIPTKTDGSKAPAGTWKKNQTEPPTTEQLARWFDASGNYDGFGIVCGAISGNLEMLEFEGRAVALFGDWLGALADNRLTDLRDRLTHGYLERTPAGGLHLLYRVSDAPANRNVKLAKRPSTEAELTLWRSRQQAGIDLEPDPKTRQKRQEALDRITSGGQVPKVMIETRGEGGYVVVAPSGGRTHPSGRAWELIAGGPGSIPLITAEEREALYQLARAFDETAEDAADRTSGSQDGHDVPESVGRRPEPHLEPGELRPGDDYNLRATWEEILVPYGWRKIRNTFGGPGQSWQRPGKDHGCSATTGTAESGDRLFVFSTSTEFDSERPYSKFAAYATLNHGGDFAAATRALRNDGYGSPLPPATGKLSFQGRDGNSTAPTQPPPGTVGATGEDPSGGGNVPPPAGGATVVAGSSYSLTDDGNALLLIDTHEAMVRYCSQRGAWLRWVGTHWLWDDADQVKELARGISRALPIGNAPEVKHKLYSLSARGMNAMCNVAASDPRIRIDLRQLDSNPTQLNTPDGALDLLTGEMLGSDPAMLHSRLTGYAPSYDPPVRLLKFLDETLFGNAELIAFIQRVAGYSASGLVTHHVLPFLHGPGGNGKGVFLEILGKVLGDYATTAPAKFLMAGNDKHETEIARLDGMRLVVCSEINQRDRFDEAKVKLLTGGDPITARFMRQDYFTFMPTHKLWLMGNHQPRVGAGGESFWRRLRLIPFTRVVTDAEKNVELARQIVAAEGPQILGWVIQGARQALASNTLAEPISVLEATAGYAVEEDALTRFVQERLHIGGGENVRENTQEMRRIYEAWSHAEGEQIVTPQVFGRELKRHRIGQVRSNGRRFYTNVTILAESNDEAEDYEERRRIWQGE